MVVLQLFEQFTQLIVTHVDVAAKRTRGHAAALALGLRQQNQNFQHIIKATVLPWVALKRIALPIRQGIGQNCTWKQDGPQNINPQQKQWNGGKRTVNDFIAAKMAEIIAEQTLGQF